MKTGKLTTLLFIVISLVSANFVSVASAQTRGARAQNVSDGASATAPQYQIFDIGLVNAGDAASQGFGVSTHGVAVGRSFSTSAARGFSWTLGNTLVGLPILSGRTYCAANSANDGGAVVGICSNSLSGTARLPVMWQNGIAAQLPLPSGQTLGDANDVNASGVAVGSAGSGTLQRGVIYSGGAGTVITQTTAGGSYFTTAFGINDSGRVIGSGIDPANAARNVGLVYEIGSSTATEVGALPGANGAIPFGISNAGHVVGASMQNQGSGMPFIWTTAGGMVAIPLPTGTTQGSARGVNSKGWTVGTASSNFAIPYLFDGSATYRLADLIPAETGWNLSTNTSSSAFGITDDGVIVGTGVLNGVAHAYAMVPVVDASISGRILTANGAGIRSAYVTVSGGDLSAPVTTMSSSFGYYYVPGLHSAQTYTVTVATKKFPMAQPVQTVTPAGNIANLDFVADPQ